MPSDVQADHEERFLDRSEPTLSDTTGPVGEQAQLERFDEDEIEPDAVQHAPTPDTSANTTVGGASLDPASQSAHDAWLREGQTLCDEYFQAFGKLASLMRCGI